MLVSLTARETAIGTNDPPRSTLGWLFNRKCSGHFRPKIQGIPTAGDVIFRFAKQTITWGCFCTKCSNDPRVETQQIFGKVHETPHAKFKSEKCPQWNTPHQNSFRLYLEKIKTTLKNQCDWSGHLEQIQRLQSMPFNIICFFSGNAVLIQRNPLPCPSIEAPYGYLRSYQQSLKRTHIKNATRRPYDLHILDDPKRISGSFDPTSTVSIAEQVKRSKTNPKEKAGNETMIRKFPVAGFFHFFSGPHFWWRYLFFGGRN